jgi:hypothetical protein
MTQVRRVLAGSLVVLVLVGMLPPSARAQQPPPPVVVQSSQPAVVEVMPAEAPPARHDIYDVGAGVVTAARMPFNVALCGLGAVTATILFVLTLGSAYRGTTRIVEEGCAQRWVVRGDDLRPRGAPGVMPEMADYR